MESLNKNIYQESKEYFHEDDYDEEYYENQLLENCPKCGRSYDEIDYEYQSCSKCGWDAENEKWIEAREPEDADFEMGDADLMTGQWN